MSSATPRAASAVSQPSVTQSAATQSAATQSSVTPSPGAESSMSLSLPPIRAAARVEALRDAIKAADIDAMIVTEATSIRWLTGFSGSNGHVVVSDDLTVITDGRYRQQCPQEMEAVGVEGTVVVTQTETEKRLAAACGSATRIGIDPSHVSWSTVLALKTAIEAHNDAAELVAVPNVLARLRQRKDDAEIVRIEAAATITDAALASVAPLFRVGVSEREFAAALDAAIRERGASGTAFETIVASGPNAALPHHRPTERAFADGDLVIIDVGAVVDGYRSDMTRTVGIGAVDDSLREIWELVVAAQQAGFEATGPNAALAGIDNACRSLITERGYGEEFMHGTGHGVGLDIHEQPMVNTRSTTGAEVGMTITIEPGIYLVDRGGVRIEDTVVVTDDGVRRLTKAPKSLAPAALIEP